MADDDDDRVPKARLDAALQQRDAAIAKANEHAARIATLEGDLRAAKKAEADAVKAAASAEALAQRNTVLEAEIKAERAARAEDAALSKAGFSDPELVRFEHARAKRADKATPDLEKWVSDMAAAPDKAPAALRALLPEQTDGGEETTTTEPQKKGTQTQRGPSKKPDGPPQIATNSWAEKNRRIAAIPHPEASPEWLAAVNTILGTGADTPS